MLVAVCLPVLILLTSFVIDVGNWYEHKRHLQLQADAAALAGGAMYTTPCDNATINTEGTQVRRARRNRRRHIQPAGRQHPWANLHLLINSTNFYNQGGSDNSAGRPCSTGFVDTKTTETDAPWFLSGQPGRAGNPTINAHARVNLFTLEQQQRFLPIALPVSDPKLGQVTFVNEATNTVLATAPLTRDGAANGNAIGTT